MWFISRIFQTRICVQLFGLVLCQKQSCWLLWCFCLVWISWKWMCQEVVCRHDELKQWVANKGGIENTEHWNWKIFCSHHHHTLSFLSCQTRQFLVILTQSYFYLIYLANVAVKIDKTRKGENIFDNFEKIFYSLLVFPDVSHFVCVTQNEMHYICTKPPLLFLGCNLSLRCRWWSPWRCGSWWSYLWWSLRCNWWRWWMCWLIDELLATVSCPMFRCDAGWWLVGASTRYSRSSH